MALKAHKLVKSEHIHAASHHNRLNRWLALHVTNSVGTMWAAYAFAILALISFPQALAAIMAGDLLTGVSWLSQAFLQLVLLPVILVGQNIQSQASDARAEADHETLNEILRRLSYGRYEEDRPG